MKGYYKILVICIIIFGLAVYITKKTIDDTFCKIEKTEINESSSMAIFDKIKHIQVINIYI